MVDFAYYRDVFIGTAIPEEEFDRCAARAEGEIASLTRGRAEEAKEPVLHAVKEALCAVAEVLWHFERHAPGEAPVQSERVGEHTVSYSAAYKDAESWERARARRVYDRARVYLGWTGLLYAGVKV